MNRPLTFGDGAAALWVLTSLVFGVYLVAGVVRQAINQPKSPPAFEVLR